jgi:MoaA/NifB/PqqE/SkfB family radical SAM enzyme
MCSENRLPGHNISMDFSEIFSWMSGIRKGLDWIQVEVSSYCNACCVYCPRAAYRKCWQGRLMPLAVYKNLMPIFKKTELVYLQGWGEPMAHPDLVEMVRLAKRAGCRVGTTTNGTLCSRDRMERLIHAGLDIIGFSLAGINQDNDRIRKGTQFRSVLRSIEQLHQLKSRHRVNHPKIHMAYMLLRSGLDDVDNLPSLVNDIGVDQAVVSTLSLIVAPDLIDEGFQSLTQTAYRDFKQRLLEVKNSASRQGGDLHCHLIAPQQDGFHCSENCNRSIVVGSDGNVSPCVMKSLPVNGTCHHYYSGMPAAVRRVHFGSIVSDSLSKIVSGREYKQFVGDYQKTTVPVICSDCLKAHSETM